jgi:hypothetical protein
MLVTTIWQLSTGKHSGFTLAMNTITIGLLSMTASLIANAIRKLKSANDPGDEA